MDSKRKQFFQECRKDREKATGFSLGGHQGGGIQSRTIHLDFPRFGGSDSSGWIYRVEHFFSYHRTPANQSFHLGITVVPMDG